MSLSVLIDLGALVATEMSGYESGRSVDVTSTNLSSMRDLMAARIKARLANQLSSLPASK